VAQQPKLALGRLTVEVYRSHTIRHTHARTHAHARGWSPLNESSARCRSRYLHNTQRAQEKEIHALSGIRTRYPSNKAAVDLHLRPRGYRNLLQTYLLTSPLFYFEGILA